MRSASTMLAGLIFALAMTASAQAAPPRNVAVDPDREPVTVRVESVNVAARSFIADGQAWALSSTAQVHVPGKKRGALSEISPGERVILELEPGSDGASPVVRSLTVMTN